MVYRHVNPTDRQSLPLRMLFQAARGGIFHRACEADSFRGPVAAILGDAGCEAADTKTRLVHRLRVAHDLALLAEVEGRQLTVGQADEPATINVASDEPLIRSFDRFGFVSLDPAIARGR